MDHLQVAEWLMMSRMYANSTDRCISCASCTVCRKGRYFEYDLDPPPRLVRVIPAEDDGLRAKTQIFTPSTTRYNPYLSDTGVTNQYIDRNNRNYCKRKISDEDEIENNKRFRPTFTELPAVIKSTSPVSTNSPPSPLQYRVVDGFSSCDEEDKNVDNETHKKEVERAKYERTIKLYKFLIDLLEDQNPCVVWITRETGIFKIKDSEKLAQLWGEVKLNPTMNYEKLARSFRHYYKKGILDSGTTLSKCGKRKLYYKFSAQMLKKYLNI